ncbi:MAG: phosphatase PAP2 family protein [Actinobacteria bacterium]|nr:phosphatase PAP2 family protein [Actinomycetota bacterium]
MPALPSPEELPAVAAFDRVVDRALDRCRGTALDRVMYTLSSAADHSLLWFAVGGVRALGRADLRFALKFAAAMGAESAITNGGVKALFRRVRPEPEVAEGPLPFGMRRPITSSFPSGHATAAFTAAVILARTGPGGPAWYGLAAVVASSRVYVRMHHASDVLAGAALGLVMGRIAARWF